MGQSGMKPGATTDIRERKTHNISQLMQHVTYVTLSTPTPGHVRLFTYKILKPDYSIS